MLTFFDYPFSVDLRHPCALTIGIFDGFHLGHRHLLQAMKDKIKKGTIVVVTFSSPPQKILQHTPYFSSNLLPLQKRLHLLENFGVDITFILPFTQKLANFSFDFFLLRLKKIFRFSYLFLGEGATLGKDKKGNELTLPFLGKELDFDVIYLKKKRFEKIISTTSIKENLYKGKISSANILLGYSYYLFCTKKEKIDKNTYLIKLKEEYFLPSTGSYLCYLEKEGIIQEEKEKKILVFLELNKEKKEGIIHLSLEKELIFPLKISFIEKISEKEKLKFLKEKKALLLLEKHT